MENDNTVWLDPDKAQRRDFIVLRLYAPESEKILIDFEPVKMCNHDIPDWNPMWEEWHCYKTPLRIYRQDYALLLKYLDMIYPVKDAFDGTPETEFDPCSDNWIGRKDWERLIDVTGRDITDRPDNERGFLRLFTEWLKEALRHTDIIAACGNL